MRIHKCAVALVATTMIGCGGDSTGPEVGTLSEELSIEIAFEIIGTMLGFGLGFESDNTSVTNGAFSILPGGAVFSAQPTETIDATVPCENGGTARITGTITDNIDAQGTGSASFDIRQTPNSCRVQTSQGLFTVNGNPDIRFTASMNFLNDEPVGNFNMAFSGGFTWSGGSPASSGSCAMNMTYSINMTTFAFSVGGSVCGHPVTL